MASIEAADISSVSSSGPDEKVKAFADGVISSIKGHDLTLNADDGDDPTLASIEKAGLFLDFNDNSVLKSIRRGHRLDRENEIMENGFCIFSENLRRVDKRLAYQDEKVKKRGTVVR